MKRYLALYTTGFPTADDYEMFDCDGDPWKFARSWARKGGYGYKITAVYEIVPERRKGSRP